MFDFIFSLGITVRFLNIIIRFFLLSIYGFLGK